MTEFGAECLVVARRALVLVAAFGVMVLLLAGLLLGRLASGPLDVTSLSARLLPITIARGPHGRPAGILRWTELDCAWEHPRAGLRSVLVLHAAGLTITDDRGRIADSISGLSVRLTPRALLRHRLAPVAIEGTALRLALRDTNGDIDLDLPDMRPGRPPPIALTALTHLALSDGRIIVRDTRRDRVAWLDRLDIAANRPPAGNWRVHAAGMVHAGGATSRLTFDTRAGPSGGLDGTLAISAFVPQAFAPFVPIPDRPDGPDRAASRIATILEAWRVPVALRLGAHLTPVGGPHAVRVPGTAGLGVASVDLGVWIGEGIVTQRHGPELHVRGGRVAASMIAGDPARGRDVRLRLSQASMALNDPADPALGDTVFRASADAGVDDLLAPRVVDVDGRAEASDLDFQTLGAVWPDAILHGVRSWFTRNVTRGTGHGLAVRVHEHSDRGLGGLTPTVLSGGLRADGVRLTWLAPIPALDDLDVTAAFDGVDALLLRIGSGQQPTRAGPIDIARASMRIDGLSARDQTGTLTLDADGALPRVLALLSEPRLRMLSRHKLPFADPTGDVHVHLQLGLPFKARIEAEDLTARAHVTFARVQLGDVVLGRSVTKASGEMDATAAGLDLTGHGLMAGIPTDATLHEDFGGGPDDRVVEHLHAVSHLDPAAVARAAIAPPGLFGGEPVLTTDYRRRVAGDADLDLALDLADADIDVPIWHKPRGTTATASAHLGLRDGHVVVLDALAATGPALSVTGHGLMGDETVRSVVLDGFRVGRSSGRARVDVPTGPRAPIIVAIDASVLDLAPLVHPGTLRAPGSARARTARAAHPWIIDVTADRLFYSNKGTLGRVHARLENDGERLDRAEIRFGAPTNVHVQLTPVDQGRHLVLDATDFGRLLSSFGVTDRVAGGHAMLDGTFRDEPKARPPSDATPPFDGYLDIGPFALLDPPGVLTAASRLSVYDWSKSSDRHFDVTRMHLPLHLDRPYLRVHDGRLGNDALGATVEGSADLSTETLALRGTIVPVFAINALPGRLPGIGRVFSPEKGGGFLATTFRITGPMAHPVVHVQPLSMLLPGALRKLVE